MRKYAAEALGSFAIMVFGLGAIAFEIGKPGSAAVAAAFGLSVLVMTLALAPVSGAHFNPAVSLGMVLARRLPVRELLPYAGAQTTGAALGAILVGSAAASRPGGAALAASLTNGFGRFSPGFFDLRAVASIEVALSALLVFMVIGTSNAQGSSRASDDPLGRSPGFAAIASGVAYGLVQLVSATLDRGCANPARAIGAAVAVGGEAFAQLPVFVLAPLAGAALAAGFVRLMNPSELRRERRALREQAGEAARVKEEDAGAL